MVSPFSIKKETNTRCYKNNMLHFRLQMHHSICQSIFLPGSHFERTVWLWCGASRRPCSPACTGLTEGQPGSLTPMPSPRPMLLWAANQATNTIVAIIKGEECESFYSDGGVSIAEPLTLSKVCIWHNDKR